MNDLILHKPDDMSNETIYISCSSDKNFVMPLTVMLVSLFAHLDRSRKVVIYILDGGIRTSEKNKLLKSVKAKNAKIRFVKINDHNFFKDMIVSEHVSIATYYRLLVPMLLPENIEKTIFLDSDLIIKADIGKLWDIDIGENYVLAVQEQYKDFLYVSSPGGLLNYKELGLNPASKYFNAGVLVINLKKWREYKISQKIRDYIRDNRKYIRWWDQDGFNAVLANKWGELDHRWNLLTQIFWNTTWEEGPIKDEKRYKELVEHPYIIHFNTGSKPWQFGCSHPYANLFIKYLTKTSWYWPWKLRMYQVQVWKLLKNILPKPIKSIMKKILLRRD